MIVFAKLFAFKVVVSPQEENTIYFPGTSPVSENNVTFSAEVYNKSVQLENASRDWLERSPL